MKTIRMIAIGYVVFMIIFAASTIGEMPVCEPFHWSITLKIGLFTALSVFLGYLAGLEQEA